MHCISIHKNILYVLLVREMQLYIKDVRVLVGNGFVFSLNHQLHRETLPSAESSSEIS